MTYVVATPPASEPITVADVKPFCRLDGTNAELAPGVVTAALAGPAAPGNVDNGAHRYLATFVTASGETEGGTVSAAVTVADKTVNGQVSLSGIPIGGYAVTARKLYRTAAGGSTYLLLATLADNTTALYTDNIADSALGAGAPALNTTDDPLLVLLIASARAHAEQELRRYLVTQTIDAFFDHFPRPDRFMDHHGMDPRTADYTVRGYGPGRYEIRLPPLQSVTSITYIDQNGTTQVLDPALYLVDAKSQPARITPAYGSIWPSTQNQVNAVTVRFVAGYGAAAVVPGCIKQWMLMRVSTMFENREQLSVGHTRSALIEVPPAYIDSLLDPERWGGRV